MKHFSEARAIDALSKASSAASLRPGSQAKLGNSLLAAGRFDEAIDTFRSVLRKNPGDVLSLTGLGSALHSTGQARKALVAFRSAIALDSSSIEGRVGAGTSLCVIEDYEGAIVQLGAAIMQDSRCAPAWYNLGCATLALGEYEAAEDAFDQALAIQPDWPAARLSRALTWLSAGDFERGLPEYEWRLKAAHPGFRHSLPIWNGENLANCTLLIHAEQGLGDTLHYLRFVRAARERTRTISLHVQPELVSLLKPLEATWGISISSTSDSVENARIACPLMSLPHVMGLPFVNNTTEGPYVQVPAASRYKWRHELSGLHRKKVGLAWSGRLRTYDNRALPVEYLDTLLAIESVDWVILQKGVPVTDATYLSNCRHQARIHQYQSPISDLADTAALIEQLDVVVTVDTSIAHLAGAMGKPVIVMLAAAADWRWRIDTTVSRWYPTARLVRQSRPGDWSAVVAHVARLLRQD